MKYEQSIINVTKTFLPPLKTYQKFLQKIWENNWITNHGPMVGRLEDELRKYLGVKYLFFVSNGTVALEIAIKALDLKGEIITTPFSYVATTSSIVWMNCKPVFVDINPQTLCIDTDLIEKAITDKTQAILATHVYGNPCDVEGINKIANKYRLKIIYDAAHCFGVKYKRKSVLNYGDISTLSFHATKLFHTAEGGAVITRDPKLAHKISYLRNFGHRGQEAFWGLGINGKNSELHAAIGLSILPEINKIIKSRRKISELYHKSLKTNKIRKPQINQNAEYNYAYHPVIFETENELLRIRKKLNAENIFPRRYFYPSLDVLKYTEKFHVPVSKEISKRVLCLPIYPQLRSKEVKKIANIIVNNL